MLARGWLMLKDLSLSADATQIHYDIQLWAAHAKSRKSCWEQELTWKMNHWMPGTLHFSARRVQGLAEQAPLSSQKCRKTGLTWCLDLRDAGTASPGRQWRTGTGSLAQPIHLFPPV